MSPDSLAGTPTSAEPDSLAGTPTWPEPDPPVDPAPHDGGPGAAPWLPPLLRPRVLDAVIVLAYLLIGFGLYRNLWLNLSGGYLVDSGQDQNLFEWFFAVQAQAVAAGRPTLLSALQNYPAGVNLMANTAMPGLAVPLTPLTLLAGPTATWALLLSGGLAGTATAWYWLFSRHLTRSRWSAAIGGGCAGFAPPMISHAHAHPNFAAGFLLAPIMACLIRLRTRRRPVRDGVVLGALLGWQVLIGEEPLLILAIGLALWTLAWAAVRPRSLLASVRSLLAGLGVAALVSVTLVGYPLWVQFTGPGSYRGLGHELAGNDLAAFPALPRQSMGGQLLHPGQLVDNPTEQNAFFGWPLLALLLVVTVWLWREVPVRLASITLAALFALSLGSPLFAGGTSTGVPGPWTALARLPLFDSLIEARLTLAGLPLIGVLLAVATDRALGTHKAPRLGSRRLTARWLWFPALAVALVPLLPVRYTVVPRQPAPVFIASGDWREYVRPGRAVLTVPPPDPGNAAALHWQVAAGLGFPLVEGYFIGPAGPERRGIYGADRPPTSLLLAAVARTGAAPPIGPAERAQALADLRSWRADVVVLPDPDGQPSTRAALVALWGPGLVRDDVLLWDVRGRAD
jgi:hypothetical protein